MLRNWIVVAGWIACCTHGAHAQQVFKWTDESGVVNYSTKPPPAGLASSAVDTGPPAAAAGSADDAQAKRLRERRQFEVTRDAREAEALQKKREAAERREAQARAKEDAVRKAAAQADTRRRQAREKCEREHRVDCEKLGAAQPAATPATA